MPSNGPTIIQGSNAFHQYRGSGISLPEKKWKTAVPVGNLDPHVKELTAQTQRGWVSGLVVTRSFADADFGGLQIR